MYLHLQRQCSGKGSSLQVMHPSVVVPSVGDNRLGVAEPNLSLTSGLERLCGCSVSSDCFGRSE
uniref:Uncharacterized protein n=1 Tax=Physcomitrium patens TaxID=3218 RepID=A0A2K1L277_PHYPA|nr:hypothetical protein PHYPA_002914 [Physcomitrium patens]